MNRRGAVLFAVMSVLWGVPYLLIRVAVRHVSPSVLVEGRTLIGALCLLPLAGARREIRPLLPAWKPLVAYTVAEIAGPWYLLSDAERRLPSSLSGLLVASVPLVGVLLGFAMGGRERIGVTRWVGLLVGIVGVGSLLGVDIPHGAFGAVGEVGLVVVGYATGPLIAAGPLSGLPSIGLAAVSLTLAAAVYLPASILTLPGSLPPARAVASIVVLGVACTAIAFVAFFELIAEIGPHRALVITYVNPAVALLLGVCFLGEPFTVATGVGFALILAGSSLATRQKARELALPSVGSDVVDEGTRGT